MLETLVQIRQEEAGRDGLQMSPIQHGDQSWASESPSERWCVGVIGVWGGWHKELTSFQKSTGKLFISL